ncbi:MAG: DUF3883 domain-containing protein [Erythrobacter sp.]|nr:DUF3883 domain-containing protein [Erythrobacter sp.]
MALELIQNADDAGASHLSFDIRDKSLVVRNSAEFTNCGKYGENCDWEMNGGPSGRHKACNVHAISTMGARSKFESADQIGRFGIGFVSVFQITDTPIIRSGNCELILNPNAPQIEPKIVSRRKDTEFELPWAMGETAVRAAIDASPVQPEIADIVLAEILETIDSSMLFLRNLKVVEVFRSGKLAERLVIERRAKYIKLRFIVSTNTQRWFLLRTSAQPIIRERNLLEDFPQLQKHKRSSEVTLAVAIGEEPVDGLLFAYLPTQQRSRLPLHLNGDFYPESSRKDIVLRGRGQEREWNEALIGAAAELIGSAFEELKEQLGAVGLWRLGKSCFDQRNDEIFGCYWKAFSNAAQRSDCVLSGTGEWLQPKKAHFGEGTPDHDEFVVLSELGLPLISEKIRPFWKTLEAAGVCRLTPDIFVKSIALRAPARAEGLRPHLAKIWQLVANIVQNRGDRHYTSNFERLQSACFLLDMNGDPVAPDDVWRLPECVESKILRDFLPDLPIVSAGAIAFAGIKDLVKEYTIERFAADISMEVNTVELARELIGADGEAASTLYELLLRFPPPSDPSDVAQSLKSVPMLRTRTGYVEPERAQLPGGFDDPTGYLELVDLKHFPLGMEGFARQTLKVSVLTFAEYLDRHLPSIVEEHGLEPQSFRAIAAQIVQHRHELASDKVLYRLSDLGFIPTRADSLVRPRDCYRWSAEAERVLGPDPENWLDEDWLPQGRVGMQFRDILEADLEMPSQPTLAHMLRRINEVANVDIVTSETVRALDIVVDRICEHLPKASEDERRSIAILKDIAFLPALHRGERDESRLYWPHEVYRATRASGFDSQVPVIDLNALRRPRRTSTDFMNLIKMPQVPPVGLVVAHLRHCVEAGAKANAVTYDLLNEAVAEERELEEIEELVDEPFIFDPVTERYLKATEVFWSAPYMGRYWKSASQDMHRQVKLYEFLGVRSSPGPEDYARLMVEISGDPEPDPNYRELHERCVVEVCRAMETEEDGAAEALEILTDQKSLIDRGGNGVFPTDVLWIDRPYLVEPFGTDLDDRLVDPPQIDRASLSHFYKRIGVEPLSRLAAQKLAQQPDYVIDRQATAQIGDRSDLLLWLAPNEAARSALTLVLADLSVALTDDLKVQVEFNVGIAPVISLPAKAQAYLEPGTLYVRGGVMSQGAWTAAFRQIFLSIEHHCPKTDIKPLATTAVLVMISGSRDEAEANLVAAEFAPPSVSGWEAGKATALGDLEPTIETEVLPEETANEVDDLAQPDDRVDNSAGAQPQDQVEVEQAAPHPPEPRASSEGGGHGVGKHTSARTGEAPSTKGTAAVPPKPVSGLGRTAPDLARLDGSNSGNKTMPADDEYKSKVGGKPFGAEADEKSGAARGLSNQGDVSAAPAARQSRTKSSRMLAYVARSGDRPDGDRYDFSDELNKEIDARAIERAMRFEADQGRSPVEQDHFNPGFDIVSTEADGKRRLIEVKGMRGLWSERGTKLTRTQFSMAQTHAEEYWLYIVEAALDANARQLYAIRNPFQQVDEYWFDSAWKGVAERLANTVQLNGRVGEKVHHEQWGSGRVLEIKKVGLQTRATVDFGFEGKKLIPFNVLKFVD